MIDHTTAEYLLRMGIQPWVPREPSTVGALASQVSDADIGLADLGVLERIVSGCENCALHKTRTHTVFGVGNAAGQWMLVGEAPGAEEDRQGLPFVGRAGQLLTSMLFALGLARDDVYIANVLKCRPPENRDPMGDEVTRCEPYLHRQVELVRPKIIVALGRFAAQSLLKTNRPIGKLRGERFVYADTGIPLIVTYHPAYLLRSPLEKRKAWQDLQLGQRIFGES
jgi:DNA polymerase